MTDKVLRSETSNTKSLLLPEYLYLTPVTYLKRPLGMWDITLYLIVDYRNGIFSYTFTDSVSQVPGQGHVVHICGVNE